MAGFYGIGVVFAVVTGVLLLRELARTLAGRLRDEDLVMVQESEDLAPLHALHGDAAALDATDTAKGAPR